MNVKIFILLLTSLIILSTIYSEPIFRDPAGSNANLPPVIIQQIPLDGNNINAWIFNTGIIDQDLRTFDQPGFEWPKGAGTFAIFSAGLTIAGYVNNVLLMSSASYTGEYAPGYVVHSGGVPVAQTDSTFHIYKVKRGDNAVNNPDWLNWGQMVPYGAPFIDVNHNGIYDPYVDTPGVKNAEQTIFLCMTDGFPSEHKVAEGFGGGTAPLFNEVHMTAWCYNTSFLQNVQFIKYDIINKNTTAWDKTYISIVSDPDLGCPGDDYIGCDTTRDLGFCYNSEDADCPYPYRYPGIVPAVGIQMLKCSSLQSPGMTSFDYFTNNTLPHPACESDPNPGVQLAYNYMKGIKSDGTPWVIPPGGQQNVTKFTYPGDPETGIGWNEGLPGNPHGSIQNCGGPNVYNGLYVPVNPAADRRMVLNSGSDNLTVNPGDTQKVLMAQFIALGTSRLNSVTKLKQLADTVKTFACGGFVIGIRNESTTMAKTCIVFPNYPNPFNPETIISYQLPVSNNVRLSVFDVLGREVSVLVNEKQNAGSYKVEWDASNFASGVYFYKFTAGDYTKTSKMILLK